MLGDRVVERRGVRRRRISIRWPVHRVKLRTGDIGGGRSSLEGIRLFSVVVFGLNKLKCVSRCFTATTCYPPRRLIATNINLMLS
jgi:hypothetical protein